MKMMGIDYGTKKIGLALSDAAGRFASPLEVIPSGGQAVAQVAVICVKEGVEKIVIGCSLDYAGEPNPIMWPAEKFADQLRSQTGLAVEFELEVLTTKEAEREIGRDALTDARAAALILKSYIDRQIK